MAIQLTGMSDFRKKMAQGNLAVIEGAKAAVTDMVVEIGKESQDLVPVDTGNLKRSIVLKFPKMLSDNPEGEIAYGGTAAPYAVVQHENPNYVHRDGRTYKYLENPVKRKAGHFFNKLLIQKINVHLKKYS